MLLATFVNFGDHSSDPLPHSLRVNFDYLPQRGGIWKIKKRGRKYGAGAGLKRGGDTFPISFFQGLSFLHLEITLPFAKLCYAFEEKLFFCHHNFMKKGHSKLSKNETENIL